LTSITEVPVVTKEGEALNETRIFVNTPLSHFYPEDMLAVVYWLSDKKKPDVTMVQTPITVDGVSLMGDKMWGSAIKKGYGLLVQRDYGLETGMFKHIRDGVRGNRWMLADGLYGAMVADGLKVKVVPEGAITGKRRLNSDGFGYISRTAADALWNGHDKIKSNGSREAFQFWSQFPWEKIADEVVPYILQDMLEVSDPASFAFNSNSPAIEEKRPFIEADDAMELHPYTTNAFGRDAADMYRRAAGTVKTNAHWKVAVPALCAEAVLMVESIMYRFPIDDFAAVKLVAAAALAADEAKRIAEMEVVQFSLSGLDFFASGCLGVLDDDEMEGADIILCSENIKLATDMKRAKAPGMKVLDNIVLCATQWYAAGSAMGLNPEFWKKMGGDFDGDLVFHFDVEQETRSFRSVAQAVSEFPETTTYKIKKSRFPIADEDRRAEMIVNNMNNIVGFASNVRETVFMVDDQEDLARRLGFDDTAALFLKLNRYIKFGTDGFKTFALEDEGRAVTMNQLEKQLGVLQSNIITVLGMMAPETGWKRSDWAFRRDVPDVVEQGQEPPRDNDRKRLAVHPWMHGTVQEIAKIALPNIKAAIGTPIESRPLTHYRPWAGEVDEGLYAAAHELQLKFNARIHRLNWQWSEQVEAFKLWWRSEINDFIAETGYNRFDVARALWNVAHSTRSTAAGAGSIFMGMPEEALRIIREKPGRQSRKPAGVAMTGLTYNVENPLAEWIGEVEVVYHAVSKNGRLIYRACVCPIGEHPFRFKQKAEDNPWPADMIGVVSAQDDQPEEGFYNAAYRQKSKSSWALTLSA